VAYNNVRRLKRVQAGLETVRGTAVAATRRLYGEYTLSVNQDILELPDDDGTFWGGDAVSAGDAEATISVSANITYEDLPWWMMLALDGAITPVAGTGSPLPYTWTATPEAETDNLKTATLEYGWTGRIMKAAGVHVRTMTISSARDDSPVMQMTAELGCSEITTGTFTAAIPQRTRENVLARGADLYIDEPGGTLGTTAVLNKYRSFSFTINNNPDYKRFGESGLWPAADFGRGQQVVTVEVVLEASDDVETAKQRLTTARKIRLQQEGSIINGAGNTPKRARFDFGNVYWNAPSEDMAGENIVDSFGGVAKPLAGVAPVIVETVNALATLP
jgi:hypothetical protein